MTKLAALLVFAACLAALLSSCAAVPASNAVEHADTVSSSPSLWARLTNPSKAVEQKEEEEEGHDIKWTQKLFDDLEHDIYGSILAFVTSAVAAGGGIGGGGLLVPVYYIVLDLGRFAIPLSKATIFGGAVANLIINLPLRHPSADRPLIAYDVAMMMEPMTLAGTVVGVILNTLFPTWLITFLLILFLGYTARKTLKKAFSTWAKETKAQNAKASRVDPNASKDNKLPHTELQEVKADDKQRLSSFKEVSDDTQNRNEQWRKRIMESERKVGVKVIFLLVATWCMIFVIALLKGGHGAASVVGMECGSAWFWISNVMAVVVMVLITKVAADHYLADWKTKNTVGYEYHEGDVRWDHHAIVRYPGLCSLAGVAAGLLGIGGGMVKGPLMLEMGILPQVSGATSAFMILFTSSATTMQFVILGMLRADYMLWYGWIGFVGAFVGKKLISRMIKKLGRPSIIMFCLGGIIGLSCIVMGIIGIVDVSRDIKNEDWDAFHFNPLCVVH